MIGAREADRKEQFTARLKRVNVVFVQEMHNDDNMKLNGDTLLSVGTGRAHYLFLSIFTTNSIYLCH